MVFSELKIGFMRIFLGLIALHFFNNYRIFLPLYFLSSALDALDGVMARKLNQATTFGAVLDMVTDRSITSGFLLVLAHLYYLSWGSISMSFFCSLILLDISSHYVQMYWSLKCGLASHKNTSNESNIIMKLYYENRLVLFTVCAGDQLYLISLYCLKELPSGAFSSRLLKGLTYFSFPIFLFKQFINVVQLFKASYNLAKLDSDIRNK